MKIARYTPAKIEKLMRNPTIIYAYLQAVGVVNDHLTTYFRHPDRRAAR